MSSPALLGTETAATTLFSAGSHFPPVISDIEPRHIISTTEDLQASTAIRPHYIVLFEAFCQALPSLLSTWFFKVLQSPAPLLATGSNIKAFGEERSRRLEVPLKCKILAWHLRVPTVLASPAVRGPDQPLFVTMTLNDNAAMVLSKTGKM
ncbi:hypothetical protein SRHO_G00307170 [Serrasalmus rhombeus]